MVSPARCCLAGWPFLMRPLCVVVAACSLWSTGVWADERLSSVIRNVEDNERLYENLEVRLETHYDVGDRTDFAVIEGGNEIVRKDVGTHFVSQEGLFRLESTDGQTDSEQKRSSRETVRLFNGEQTKLLVDKALGNLIPGRAEDSESVRPHTLLLRHQMMPAPLSAYLRGHDAVAAVAGGNWLEGHKLVITYGGEDEFQGLKCHQIEIKTIFLGTPDAPRTISKIWLAESRNYLPIRWLMWSVRLSAEIPRVEGVVSELRELKPGIWFPVQAQVTSYQQGWLLKGKQEVQWREKYSVESVSLEPQYALAYFNDLEFPHGTAVYEVEDGKIKKSYRIGAPEAPDGPPAASMTGWWLLWGNLAVLALIAGAVIWRRRRVPKSADGGTGAAGA
jgi:hypothetical protein